MIASLKDGVIISDILACGVGFTLIAIIWGLGVL